MTCRIKAFLCSIIVISGYRFLNVFWFWFIIFWLGEMVIYTLEKLLGYDTIVRWYDLIWLLFIYTIAGINSYVYFLIITNKELK